MALLEEAVIGLFSLAGPELSRIMLCYPQLNPFENKNSLILDERKAQALLVWFYSIIPSENGSPYDLCKRGKSDYLAARLINLAIGNIGS